MSIQRELPVARVRCCTSYLVSMLHFAEPCAHCGLTPKLDELPDWWVAVAE